MMNQNQQMPQMPQMGGNQQMTDEELRKLAMLLQQIPEGEGLATINQNEAQLMIDEGGSGRPLPGTEGLGVAGGPVRSYDSSISDQENAASGNTTNNTANEGDNNTDNRGTTSTSNNTDNRGNTTADTDPTGTDGMTAEQYHASVTNADYDPNDPSTWATNDNNSNTTTTTAVAPPPPKYYDINGAEFDSPDAAAASDLAITNAMRGIEDQTLTTDSTFEVWFAANKDLPAYAGLTPEQLQTAYTTAYTKAQGSAAAQVPQMVEAMNAYANTPGNSNNLSFDEFTTYLKANNNMPANLSEATMRGMFANAVKKFQRGEAFTLTPAEVAEFSRTAIKTAGVTDAAGVTIGSVADATTTAIGSVADVDQTTVDAIASVTDADIDEIFAGGTDRAEALLLARVNGTADSPAERQLFRTSEQNMRMLLGATAGGDADPAKVRQLRNIWSDMTQISIGQAADLRSQESLAAESQLVELYRGKDTMKLNTRLANMEKEKQTAFKNGDLELAGKLSNQQTALQRVITQASLDTNVKLANLEKAKQLAIEQGKTDLAVNIANLQKNLTIATVDAKLAVQQRALDDGLAMAAFQGQKELYGLETEIDMDTMKNDLTKMGFDLTYELALLDAATKKEVARLVGDYNAAIASDNRDSNKEAAIIGAIGTIIGMSAKSDIRAKNNISPGSSEVESFLDALNSYKYEYKDPNGSDEDGEFVGIMAQDLEKTAMGASFVKDTPDGKMVDYGHGLAAILASQANIHDRLRTIEEG